MLEIVRNVWIFDISNLVSLTDFIFENHQIFIYYLKKLIRVNNTYNSLKECLRLLSPPQLLESLALRLSRLRKAMATPKVGARATDTVTDKAGVSKATVRATAKVSAMLMPR